MRDVFDGDESHRRNFVASELERMTGTAPEDPQITARKAQQTARHLAWLDQRDGISGFGGALRRTTAGDGEQRDD